MKVYINEPWGSCSWGGVLVAANSVEEAINTWHNFDGYDNMIGDDFREFKGVSYDSEEPCVILNDWDLDWLDMDNSESRVQELIEELKKLVGSCGIEEAHMRADEILCDIIAEYGHPEVRDIFNKIDKWYA